MNIGSQMNFHFIRLMPYAMQIHFRSFLSHDNSEKYQYFLKKTMYFEKIPYQNRPEASCLT